MAVKSEQSGEFTVTKLRGGGGGCGGAATATAAATAATADVPAAQGQAHLNWSV